MPEKKKIPLWLKILLCVMAVLLACGVGIGVYANYLYGKMHIEKPEDVKVQEETFEIDEDNTELEETAAESVTWNDSGKIHEDEKVINLLLAGEEAIGSDADRGRTDCIMIATMNQEKKTLKLTSLLRDLYVQIPGYQDNKLNAAFGIGGMPLLEETVEKNFDISIDGYVLVDFEDFEKLIDYLGGVEVELSSAEATYLNTTNYIGDYWNHNLYAGTVNMNGDQALGYARVRYVNNGNLSGDFGRTKRQRDILDAIFQKVKSKNAAELVALLPVLMDCVTTNLTRTQCVSYITDFVNLGADELDTMQIPVDDGYKLTRIRGMSVLLPEDLKKNNDALREFIFGKTAVRNNYKKVYAFQ